MNKKRILVIGASSGIGRCTALMAQKREYRVGWASRSIEQATELASEINADSIVKNVDVSKEESVKKLFAFIKDKWKGLDAIVNCAGFVQPESMINTSLENWNKTLATNLTGTFLCSKYASLMMRLNGGKIINISSTSGVTPRPGWSAYAAAKSGVINFSNSIAEELKDYRIRVYVICPGRTATPLRRILSPNEDPNTIMQAEAVAKVILHCLEDESNCLEGQPILVRERL